MASSLDRTRVVGGRYVVLAELGRGGMGIVWRAEDRVMGRHVAVKELHLPDGLAPADRLLFRERLLREARTAGRLDDPGIVTVYDVVTDNGVDHIVMELIEARTLDDVVTATGPLDERTVADLGRQLLSALRVAHESGVVHRDVKPSNVMLAPGGRVKLTDFGIALAADDLRLTGPLVGSPGYVSPERLDGVAAAPAADQWAVGATLYFALAGQGPFQRDTTAATISAVRRAEPPQVRTRGPLGSVIAGLLQKDPQARLSGMQAGALLASGTAPDTPAPPRQPWRRIGIALAAGLVVGAAAGLTAGLALGGAGAPDVRVLTYGPDGDVPVYEIGFEYCIDVAPDPGRQIDSSATVDCAAPHSAEVFGIVDTFTAQETVPYPAARLAELAVAACALRFDSAAVAGADKDRLTVTALVPSEAEFGRDTAGSGGPTFDRRSVYCVLAAADGSRLTGTRIAEPG